MQIMKYWLNMLMYILTLIFKKDYDYVYYNILGI